MRKVGGNPLYLACTAAMLMAAGSANANLVTVTARFQDYSADVGLSVTINSNYGNGGYLGSVTSQDTVAGVYNFTVSSYGTGDPGTSPQSQAWLQGVLGPAPAGPGSSAGVFQAVCVDFTHEIYWGSTHTWSLETLDSMGNLQNGVGISVDQQTALANLWSEKYNAAALSAVSPADMPAYKAAFQMAAWDLVYNGGGTYSAATSAMPPGVTPSLSYSGYGATVSGTASTWASTAWGSPAPGTHVKPISDTSVYALVDTSSTTQDFNFAIVAAPKVGNGGPAPVPLPESAGVGFAMLAGFGGLFAFRKRLSRRPRIA